MALKLVSDNGSNQEGPPPPAGPRQPEKSPKHTRRDMLIGTTTAVGGMTVEATLQPLQRLYRLLFGDSGQVDFPDRRVLDELEARRQGATGEDAAIDLRNDTNDKALNAGTTDPARPTTSEETFEDRMARKEREQKAKLESELEAGINEHISPEKIDELEERLKSVPTYLKDLQLRFKPNGKLEAADEAKIRAFLAETLKCNPEDLAFNQYQRGGNEGVQKSVYIDFKGELIASIDGDNTSDGNVEFLLIKLEDTATGIRALRIEIDAAGKMHRYHHKLIHNGKEETYNFSKPSGRTEYSTTNASGQLLEKISLSYDSTGKAESATRQVYGDAKGYEYYYCDRAAFDEVHKK